MIATSFECPMDEDMDMASGLYRWSWTRRLSSAAVTLR